MPSLSDMETMENAMRKLREHAPENGYEGAKCPAGHPMELTNEGYGLCGAGKSYSTWAFSLPAVEDNWTLWKIYGKDGSPIPAWLGWAAGDRATCMSAIQADIDARRSLPFDEERERARLMPV